MGGVTSAASEMLKEQGGKMVPLEDPAGAGAEAGPLAHVVGLLCYRVLGEWGGGMGGRGDDHARICGFLGTWEKKSQG